MTGRRIKCLACSAILFCILAGCSSVQSPGAGISGNETVWRIDVGDEIEIKTGPGEHRTIIVSSLSETHIESGADRFAIDELEIVAVRKASVVERGASFGAALAFAVLLQALVTAVVRVVAF